MIGKLEAELGEAAADERLHRALGPAQGGGNLGNREPVDVAQYDRGARSGRQAHEGGGEPGSRLTPGDVLVGARASVGPDRIHPGCEHWLQLERRVSIHGTPTAVTREIDHDRGQPRPEAKLADASSLVSRQGAVGPHERVLGHLLSVARIAEESHRDRVEAVLVGRYDGAELTVDIDGQASGQGFVRVHHLSATRSAADRLQCAPSGRREDLDRARGLHEKDPPVGGFCPRRACDNRAAMRMDEQHDELIAALGGFYRTWIVYLGVELGLFHAIRAAGPTGITTADLATRTGTHPKAVATWAWAADAHGLVEAGAVLRVDEDLAAVLLDEQRTAFLGGQFVHSVVATLDWDRMVEFFQSGIPAASRPDRYRAAIEQVTRQDIAVFFAEALAELPDLVARLSAGGRVLDVHCGGGRWLVAMAQRFPNLELVGVEAEADSRARAVRLIEDTELEARIRIEEVGRGEVTRPGRFDLIYYQYALHALPDPSASLRASWDALLPEGTLLVLDWLLPTDSDELHSIHGELIAGVHLDEVFMGSGLHDVAAYEAWYAGAGIPAPEIIELPSGATLFALRRSPTA